MSGTPLLDYVNDDRRRANPTRWETARPEPPKFPGPAYDAAVDEERLTGLAKAVFDLMKDSKWRTFAEIKTEIKRGSENGIAATLRSFRYQGKGRNRKKLHTVNKRRRGNPTLGLHEYSVVPKRQG